jgi:hypothetical protein
MKRTVAALALACALPAFGQSAPVPTHTITLPSPTVHLKGPGQTPCSGPYVWWPIVTQPEQMCAIVSDSLYKGTLKGTRTETYPNHDLYTIIIDGVVMDTLGNHAVYHQTWTGSCGRGCSYTPLSGTLTFNP